MGIYYTKKIFGFILLLISISLKAQSNFSGLGETGLTFNKSFSENYKANFSLKSRYFLYQDASFSYDTRQLDLAHFSTFKIGFNYSASLGFQYRERSVIDNGPDEIRLTQQVNYKSNIATLRVGHRFRLEERFFEKLTVFRLRYRLAIDRPLQGQKLDTGEGYLIGTAETVSSFGQNINTTHDIRFSALLGWQISKTTKLQGGLEYRMEAYNVQSQHVLFLLTSAIIQL